MNVLIGRGVAVSVAACVVLVVDGTDGAVEVSTSRAMTPAAPSEGRAAHDPAARARHAGGVGAAGVRDTYFPNAGNGGYDVGNYVVDLRFFPRRKRVVAAVTIAATATQDLSAFNLDYRGPKILSITVDGAKATYRRRGQELTVRPATGLRSGAGFTTIVRYAGRPGPLRNNALGTYGWVPARDGALVVAEPDGAPTWLPCNDHPSDKATFTFRVTVPKGLRVLANGAPSPPVAGRGTTTYVWNERSPMATYLAMIAIGKFAVQRGAVGKTPVITAVDPTLRRAAKRLHRTTIAAVAWESKIFGPYPFSTAGGIVDDPRLDYALESQERPVYAGFAPDEDFIVHELAHQWYGDSVSLSNWQDIWLNEGFATYAEWMWHEYRHKTTTRKIFKRYYAQPATSPIFRPPPGRPGRNDMFGYSVYIRGAMALQALRDRVGSPAFFTIMREWAARHRDGNVRTSQFIALAEQISHRPLRRLFRVWLYEKGKPRRW
ncbi:MAG TPA: M1 family metallopeptidase [Streptosporangiaceae bacterium]|nr:M1 family metallopeptidase [Streptosporangiaceae bacterium]